MLFVRRITVIITSFPRNHSNLTDQYYFLLPLLSKLITLLLLILYTITTGLRVITDFHNV